MIRVLVAEDARSVRLLLVSLLDADPEVVVVGEAADGAQALELARVLRPDVITMDVHMPVMDGLEATERIMHEIPTPIVVVSSTVDPADVATTFRATGAGALAAVRKPGAGGAGGLSAEEEGRAFVETVKAMARVKVVRRWSQGRGPGGPPQAQDAPRNAAPRHPIPATATTGSALGRRISLVAIAASTGGPPALQRLLAELPGDFPAPILLVQHMARGFLAGFADWLAAETSLAVRIARAGEPLTRGTVFLAPEHVHLGVTRDGKVRHIAGPPVDGFCPSATVMFESAADATGESLAAVILTGMGSDGVAGLRRVRDRGGYVIAQDEETSIIYGMPGEAVRAGTVTASLPIGSIAPHLKRLVAR